MATVGKPGETGGEDGQVWVAGGGWCGVGDAGCPFTDAGLRVFELVVEVTLGAPLGGAAAGGSGGSQVVVGDVAGGPPHLDVGDQFGVEAGELLGPPRSVLDTVGCLVDFFAELAGEAVARAEVGL